MTPTRPPKQKAQAEAAWLLDQDAAARHCVLVDNTAELYRF